MPEGRPKIPGTSIPSPNPVVDGKNVCTELENEFIVDDVRLQVDPLLYVAVL